jgi:nitrite reductase/ring-hydroxylating ferredoxin subunit
MADLHVKREESTVAEPERRKFLGGASRAAMVVGLAGGYGGLGLIAGRFLYPASTDNLFWQYVTTVDRMTVGDSFVYRGPSGETISITRQGRGTEAGDFIALSSTCPHLGCQVHWEAQNERFFCPCHNGTFDASGVGTGGPPGDAGQSLPRYDLKIEGGLLYIAVSRPSFATKEDEAQAELLAEVEGIHAPGHDPCLAPGAHRRTGDKKA